MNSVCLKALGDLDAPNRRDASTALTPFKPRSFFGTQGSRSGVDDLPREDICRHGAQFGRFVQIVKDQLPKDSPGSAWHNLSMPEKPASSEYTAELVSRVKVLRESMKTPDGVRWTSEQMAKALDIPADRYRKYESRTPLPHELLERFALIVGVTVEYLVTGNKPASIATARYRKRAVDSSKAEEKRA